MLDVSKRTLQRYRSSGELPHQMVYRKTFYKESDVEAFIKANFAKGEDTVDDPEGTDVLMIGIFLFIYTTVLKGARTVVMTGGGRFLREHLFRENALKITAQEMTFIFDIQLFIFI